MQKGTIKLKTLRIFKTILKSSMIVSMISINLSKPSACANVDMQQSLHYVWPITGISYSPNHS